MRSLIGWSLVWVLGSWAPAAWAQVVPDLTLGPDLTQLQQQGNQITIEGGATRGTALFHSFEQLSIPEAQQILFANPQGIDTIFSRVTGSTPSDINGTLGVLGSADFFLLNPNGISFGPNAQLNLTGSFTASTANSVQFGDIDFSAVSPTTVPLLTVNIAPGIQLGTNAPNRTIQNQAQLTLAPQQQLTLDGGVIQQAGQIIVPGGTVDLRGESFQLIGEISTRSSVTEVGVLRLAAPGDLTIQSTAPLTNQALGQALFNNEVVVTTAGNLTLVGALNSPSPAPLTLNAGSDLSLTSDGSGPSTLVGSVTLQSGGNQVITNSLSVINPQTTSNLTLQAGGDVIIPGTPLPITIDSFTQLQLVSNQGRFSIQANSLTAGVTFLLTSTNGGGQGPEIGIDVNQDIDLQTVTIGTRADNGQIAGDITIRAGHSLSASAFSFINSVPVMGEAANTGTIDIRAADTLLIQASLLQTQAFGNSGDINLAARQIVLDGSVGQSLVAADTQMMSVGNAGNVTLNATERVELVGNQPGPFIPPNPEGLTLADLLALSFGNTTIQATAFGVGSSGLIEVNTDQLIIRDGALVANAAGLFDNPGPAGDVVINARDIQLQGFAAIATGAIGPGDSGELTITSERITLSDGGSILTSTIFGAGNAGELRIQTQELMVANGSTIAANSENGGSGGLLDIQAQSITVAGTSIDGSFPSTLLTDTAPLSTGPGGELQLQTDTLNVLDGGQIRAGTRGTQTAGNLSIIADQVIVSGTGFSGIPSTIEAQSTGTGQAGTLNLQANRLTVSNLAQLTTQSLLGSGGDINLSVADLLLLDQQGTITATAGTAGTAGNGGNIDLDVGFIVSPPGDNSDITANAFTGTGGNIDILTNGLFGIAFQNMLTTTSDITASSTFGLDGTVIIGSSADDVNTEPQQLPGGLVNPEDQLLAGCALDTDASFTVTGRGGIPASPSEILNQALIWQEPQGLENRAKGGFYPQPAAIAEAQGWQRTPQGQIQLIATQTQPVIGMKQVCDLAPNS